MTSPGAVSFGFGCMVFEVASAGRGKEWTFEEWRTAVEEALKALPNVTEVSVSFDASTVKTSKWTPAPAPLDGEKPQLRRFEPELDAVIRFDITLPKRLHHELLRGDRGNSYPCERFRVETRWGFFGPYTIVTVLDGEADGSTAVIMLWRFLEREINKADNRIQFALIGPTPFHANASLRPGPVDQIEDLSCRLVDRRGYATYEFWYSTTKYATPEKAQEDLYFRLGKELTLYYWLVRMRNRSFEYGRLLRARTQTLVAQHQDRGVRAAFRRVFRTGGDARSLGLDALDAKVTHAGAVASAENHLPKVYEQTNNLAAFKDFNESEVIAFEDPAIENALEVVRFVEGGRSKEMELAVVGASTLLGGLAGAVAALVAR